MIEKESIYFEKKGSKASGEIIIPKSYKKGESLLAEKGEIMFSNKIK